MTKLRTALLVAIVFVFAGCAQQPVRSPAASATGAARYKVSAAFLRVAANYGYRPTIINGNVMFCRYNEDLGSYIDKTYCYDTERMKLQLEREGRWGLDARHGLEKPNSGCWNSTTCG